LFVIVDDVVIDYAPDVIILRGTKIVNPLLPVILANDAVRFEDLVDVGQLFDTLP
jgi:hypothetical protein